MKASDPKPIETLRFSDRDRDELLASVALAGNKTVQDERRRLRVAYTRPRAVLSLFTETGAATKFVVMPRNLSRLGVAFVLGRFMFPNTRCEIMLQRLDDKWVAVQGSIRSCRHVQGMVHEVAVVFDTPIDLPAFSELSPEQEMWYLEDVNKDLSPEEASRVHRVTGRVLVIDTFAVDRKLFSLWLSRSGFTSESVGCAADALSLLHVERFDLALVELMLGQEEGLDLIRKLVAGGVEMPVIAMSADDSERTRQSAIESGASAFLTKPFTEAELVEHVQELVGVDVNDKTDLIPIFSTSAADTELRPLLAEFVRGLGGYIAKLRDASAAKDLDTIQRLTRTLKGAGSGYGFAPVTDAAAQVLALLDTPTQDTAQIKTQVQELVQVLNRVRM